MAKSGSVNIPHSLALNDYGIIIQFLHLKKKKKKEKVERLIEEKIQSRIFLHTALTG